VIAEDTARLLVRDGILEKVVDSPELNESERSVLREEAVVRWALDKRKGWDLARRVKKEKAAKDAATQAPAPEKPLGV